MAYEDKLDGYSSHARTEKEQMRALQLSALTRVYEGADRILTGDPVVVHLVPNGPAASWSDGQDIYLNEAFIKDMDMETLTQVSALNYHELAHHFYTPRAGTTLVKAVIENDHYTAFNLLEDQRIESLLCARYPSIMPFLEAGALRWLGSSPETAGANYPLIAGRRYLPVEVREAFRDMFYKPELIPDIQRIVGEYRSLAFPRDYKRAGELIKEFNDIVVSELDIPPMCGAGGCESRTPAGKGRPEPGKAQERDAKVAAGQGKTESFYIPKPPADPQEAKEQQPGNGQGEPDPNGQPTPSPSGIPIDGDGDSPTQTAAEKTAADASAPKDAEEEAKARESKQDTPKKLTYGVGHHASKGSLPKEVKTLVDDALDSVLNRKDVIKDIKRKQNVIVRGDEKFDEDAELGKFALTSVNNDSLQIYKQFATELRKLKDDSEPHWLRETPTGKLNPLRVMRGTEIDKAFDQWTDGDDSTDIEAIILVDRSGSMTSDNNDRQASVACWTIKRALEHIDCPVTVYAFDDETELAYSKHEKANRTQFKYIHGNGGTNPHESLLLAEKTFMVSKKPNKIMFMITDGHFPTQKNDEVIDRISKRGVLTSMVLIMRDSEYQTYMEEDKVRTDNGHKPNYEFRHGAEIFAHVNTGRDLLQLAKSVVVGAIKKRKAIR